MKKKVLSAVLAASMCMSFLAGCGNSGSGDSGSSQSGETSKETSKEAVTSAAEKGDGEPVSITVGVGQQFTTLGSGPFHGDSQSFCPGPYVCRPV